MSHQKPGIVYLAGAGPGDAQLITLRAVQCLAASDVVVYDNLANSELLHHAPPGAELIFAGKEASRHSRSQDEINEILAERAGRGLAVTRLKGGDPFLFGRGGEEAAYLAERGIPFEIVPGVTSAIAVPAFAGIPVTHRGVNGSLHIVTGHENVEGVGPDLDWDILARSRGTIAFLMGVGNVKEITRRLILAGMPPDTPAAMIRSGTLADQDTLVSTLDRLAADVELHGLKPPAVGVIGEVVRLRETLAWAEKRPLFGMRIAVTRPLEKSARLMELLRRQGAEAVCAPTIRIVPRGADEVSARMLENIRALKYDAIIFTSASAAEIFRDRLMEAGLDTRSLHPCRVAAIGARTASALRGIGLAADITAEDSRQEGLAAALAEHQFQHVLIPRASEARPLLEQILAERGAQTDIWPLYDSIPDQRGITRLVELLENRQLHAVTFTSMKTFQHLAEAVAGEKLRRLLEGVRIAVIGPATRQAVEDAGVIVSAEAARPDMESLAEAIAAIPAEHRHE